MTYAEKLRDPRWQKTRLEVLQRDHWMCQDCYSTTKTLHVHHLDYEKDAEPWEYPLSFLLTLCEDCHKDREDGKRDRENEMIKAIRVSIKSQFVWERMVETFVQFEDIEQIMFHIWEFGEDKIIKLLNAESERRQYVAEKVLQAIEKPCAACGGKVAIEAHKYPVIMCTVCGWRPEYEILDNEELNNQSNA